MGSVLLVRDIRDKGITRRKGREKGFPFPHEGVINLPPRQSIWLFYVVIFDCGCALLETWIAIHSKSLISSLAIPIVLYYLV